MPGTSSRMNRRCRTYRQNYFITNNNHNNNNNDNIIKKPTCIDIFCCTFLVFILTFIIGSISLNNYEYNKNKELFINSYIIPYSQREKTNNYTCNLEYYDRCNQNHKSDMNGIKICKFKHYLDTKKMKSQDEDGIWKHINITNNDYKLSILMKRNEFLVSINGTIKYNSFSNIINFNGRYYVFNGYNNSIYGNCIIE